MHARFINLQAWGAAVGSRHRLPAHVIFLKAGTTPRPGTGSNRQYPSEVSTVYPAARNASTALVPPNANELDSMVFPAAPWRAALAT